MIKKTLAGSALAAATLSARAACPDKAVTMAVPFPPGGSTDAIARVLTQKQQEKLGQSFIVDNTGGAPHLAGVSLAALTGARWAQVVAQGSVGAE